MSVNSSFTLCPKTAAPTTSKSTSAFFNKQPENPVTSAAGEGDQKGPSLLVRSLHRGNSPATSAAAAKETTSQLLMYQKHDAINSKRLLRGTFPENLRDSAGRSHASEGSVAAAAIPSRYAPFEALVNERNMTRDLPISPLSHTEFLAWKQNRQRQNEALGDTSTASPICSSQGMPYSNHETVDWEEESKRQESKEGVTKNKEQDDDWGPDVPSAYKKRRLQQLEARKHILTNMNGAHATITDTKSDTAFQAPRAIRATPFEPLVHQRNLNGGRLSVGFSCSTHGDQDTPWKRRYQQSEIARLGSRQLALDVVDQNRQLKIQLIHQEADQLASLEAAGNHQSTYATAINSRKRSPSYLKWDEQGRDERGRSDASLTQKNLVSSSSKITSESKSAISNKNQNDTPIMECEEEDNEGRSFVNLERVSKGQACSPQQESGNSSSHPMCEMEENDACAAEAMNVFGSMNDDLPIDPAETNNLSKEERDDSALLGCCWDRADTSNISDASSHKRRRLSFDVDLEPLPTTLEEPKKALDLSTSMDGDKNANRNGEDEIPADAHVESAKKSECSTSSNFLLDASSASQYSKSGCEVVFEGGDNSLSALDVSAITNASPTPVKRCKVVSSKNIAHQEKLQDNHNEETEPVVTETQISVADKTDISIEDNANEIDQEIAAEEEPIHESDDTTPFIDKVLTSPSSTKNLQLQEDLNQASDRPERTKVPKRSKKSRRKRTPMKGLLKPAPSRVTRSLTRKSIETAEKSNHDLCVDDDSDISTRAALDASTNFETRENDETETEHETSKASNDDVCPSESIVASSKVLGSQDNIKNPNDQDSDKRAVLSKHEDVENMCVDGDKKEAKMTEDAGSPEEVEPLALSLGSTSNALQQPQHVGKRRGRRRRGKLAASLQAPALKKNRRQIR